ncbi:hypothetical protein JQC92_09030 [Shewanella sp. 202IG2-18]|uniref:hypothetical protein n=1 Tax=Parashewanella hymeniacidonis TaxID=2807618 RepID=UPI001961F7B4|nr:hypothetical protein [Parashewanella hymeniacidonis]MBM7072168.1 hypothetical protein [Parashewanella hymeniacidonis]
MKLIENLYLPIMIVVWLILTVVIVSMVYKVSNSALPDANTITPSTDWPANLIALLGVIVTASLMSLTIYASNKKSNEQLSAIQAQISQAQTMKDEEKREKDKRALVEIEHYYQSYISIYPILEAQTYRIKKTLENPAAVDLEVIRNSVNTYLSRKFDLPDKPDGLDRLSPELIEAYRRLYRHDSNVTLTLLSMLDDLNGQEQVIELSTYVEKTHFEIGNYFRDMAYEIESFRRKIYNLGGMPSQIEWTKGFFLKPHTNGFLVESVRYPKIRGWTKQQLELRKYNFAAETVDFEFLLIDVDAPELLVNNMKQRLKQIITYKLQTQGDQPVHVESTAPWPRNRHERMWQ